MITIFREEATSALAVFMRSSLLVELEFGIVGFADGEKPENPDKRLRSKVRTKNKRNPRRAGF